MFTVFFRKDKNQKWLCSGVYENKGEAHIDFVKLRALGNQAFIKKV